MFVWKQFRRIQTLLLLSISYRTIIVLLAFYNSKSLSQEVPQENTIVNEVKLESEIKPEVQPLSVESDDGKAVVTKGSQKTLLYTPQTVDSSQYEPYLTTLNLGETSLSDNFIIYGSLMQEERYYIPISSFAQIMQIPLEQKGDLLVGWFLNESNAIEINTKTGFAKIGKQTYQFTANDAIMLFADMLISTDMMDKLFPMEEKFDLSQQVLNITTKTPFPIEQAISRSEILGKLDKNKSPEAEELRKAKIEVQEYKMFSMPNIDMTYRNMVNVQTLQMQQSLSFSSASHLLKSSLNTTGTVTTSGLNSMRVSLRKNDSVEHPFEHYLMPKQYWIGDIASPSANLVSGSTTGIGASVSNIPPGWKIDFNNLQITGYAIPNWSVEIYLNNNLLSFSTVDATGLYMFEDIPLSVGVNAVKLIFYGPFGQTREITQKVNLSSSLLPKGKFVYDLSVLKERTTLIQTPSFASQRTDATTGSERYFGSVRYGIGGKTSLAVGMTSYLKNFTSSGISSPERQNYVSSSFITNMFGVVVNTDLAYHANSNEGAAKLSFNTPIFKESNLFVTTQIFTKKFLSESRMQNGDSAQQSSTEFRIKNGTKLFGKLVAGTYSLIISTLNSGDTNKEFSAQHSMTPIKPIAISNMLNARMYSNGMNISTGSTNVTFKTNSGIVIRGTVNYIPLFSDKFFSASSLTGNYNWGVLGVTSSYNFNLIQNIGTYMVGLNVNSKYLTTSLQFGTQNSSAVNLNLNFNRGLTFNGIKPSISSSGAATGGAIEVSAFMDANNNGEWDFDEQPAKNVAAKISGSVSKEVTDENGKILLVGLPAEVAILFDGDITMMDGMSMKVSQSVKRKIILKAGSTHKVLIPIVKIIDIEGTLMIQMGEEKLPIGNAKVQLIDRDNQVVDTVTTTQDGYYVFSGAVQGKYKVRAEKAVVERYKNYLQNK